MNLPTSIVNRVKEYAEKTGINTTSAYVVLLNQALDQKESIESLPLILNAFKEFQKYRNEEDN
jgi:hypothetical protein